jgi:hypothetical protein
MAGGQKGRKIGRNKARPSQMRYTQSKRWVANKARAIKRHTRHMAKAAIRRIMRLAPSQRDNGRLQELRHIVSQNGT